MCIVKERVEIAAIGFTWDVFNEHGPLSNDYSNKKDREKYKAWFNDHKQFFEQAKLMDYWVQDNQETVTAFKRDFVKAYNSVAKRTTAFKIELQ